MSCLVVVRKTSALLWQQWVPAIAGGQLCTGNTPPVLRLTVQHLKLTTLHRYFFFSEISNIFIYLYRSILPRIWAQYARIFSVKTHWNPFLYSSIPGSRSTDRVIGKTPAGLYLILQNPSTWSWTTILWVPLHSAVYDWSRSGERCEILSHHPRNQSWREGRFFSINILSFCHHHNTRVQRPDKLQEIINFHFYHVEHFPTTIS